MQSNQPVIVRETGEWGRITGFADHSADYGDQVYRVEFPDGSESWFEEKYLAPSTTLAALNTPYFWGIGVFLALFALAVLVSN